jgi:hypothetical protein
MTLSLWLSSISMTANAGIQQAPCVGRSRRCAESERNSTVGNATPGYSAAASVSYAKAGKSPKYSGWAFSTSAISEGRN